MIRRVPGSWGRASAFPIYNALDPATHSPRRGRTRALRCDLGFLGNRLPDREHRVEQFFLHAAQQSRRIKQFSAGRQRLGRQDHAVRMCSYVGHVYTPDHNAFNCTPRMVLNISRDSMAEYGFSPATRVFEAAGAGACLITDYWQGIEEFFEPDKEILVARDGDDVERYVNTVSAERALGTGQAAYARVLTQHTYTQRVAQLETLLDARLDCQSVMDYQNVYYGTQFRVLKVPD